MRELKDVHMLSKLVSDGEFLPGKCRKKPQRILWFRWLCDSQCEDERQSAAGALCSQGLRRSSGSVKMKGGNSRFNAAGLTRRRLLLLDLGVWDFFLTSKKAVGEDAELDHTVYMHDVIVT